MLNRMNRLTHENRILVTGASGLLGAAICSSLRQSGHDVLATMRSNRLTESPTLSNWVFDFESLSAVEISRYFEMNKVSTIIHLAAMSNADECEANQERCQLFNVDLTRKLAQVADSAGVKFVFASTNAVYDGNHAPYGEASVRNPLHAYGRSKRDAEDLVAKHCRDYLIFRFILSFGWAPPGARVNPLTQIMNAYKKGVRHLKMVDDLYANSLYAKEGARAVETALRLNMKNEIFNVAGATRQSRYDFALSVQKAFQLDDLKIESVPSSAFPALIPRPKDTSFDSTKMNQVLKIKALSVNDALKDCANESTL